MPSFRNKWWLIAGLVFLLVSCNYEDVEVKQVKSVSVEELDKTGISFSAKLHVSNPNGYRIKVTSSDADLYLDGRMAGKAELRKAIVIPKDFDGEITASVRTDFEGGSLSLIPIVLGAAVKGKVDLRAQGNIKAKSFLIGQKFDFDYSHKAKL